MSNDDFDNFSNDDDNDAGFVQAQMKVIFDELMIEKLEQRIVGKLAKHYGQNDDQGIQIESPFVRILRQADEKSKREKKENKKNDEK